MYLNTRIKWTKVPTVPIYSTGSATIAPMLQLFAPNTDRASIHRWKYTSRESNQFGSLCLFSLIGVKIYCTCCTRIRRFSIYTVFISFHILACLWSKMPMFQRVGMRKGRGSLPLAFQYLILMIKRPCDLNLVMISSLASKCQHFKLRGLQFHIIKWLKKGHSNFKVLAFWSQWRYHYQIQIIRSLYHKNQILKC